MMKENKIIYTLTILCIYILGQTGRVYADDTIDLLNSKNIMKHSISKGINIWIHSFGETKIVEVLLTSNQCRLKIIESKENDLPNQIYEKHSSENTVLLLNGGFFGYDNKGHHIPIGLVKNQGKRINSLIPWSSGGVLVANDNYIDIIPAKDAKAAANWPEAIQSKPIIITKNKVDVRANLRDAPYNRSSFGITTKNEIYIVGLFHSFGEGGTLLTFANIVLEAAKARGIELKSSIAMDGGPGAHIYIPAINQNFGEGGTTYVPNIISVTGCEQ